MTHPRPFILPLLLLTVESAGCDPQGDGGDPSATEPNASSTATTTTAASTSEPTGGDASGAPTSTGDDDDTTGAADPDDSATASASTTGVDDGTTTLPVDDSTGTGADDDTTTTGADGTTTTGTTLPDDGTTTTGTTGPDDETTTGGALACSDGVAWVRHIPGHAKARLFNKLAVDANDNLFAAGNFWQTVDFGGGPVEAGDPTAADAVLVKYGPQGEHLWTRQFGGVDEQRLSGLALAGDGDIVVAGSFRGALALGDTQLQSAGLEDGFVARLDPAGVPLWSRHFGGVGDDAGLHVAVDSAGNVVLTARSAGPVDFGAGPLGQGNAIHVVKFDPDGAALWHRSYDAQYISARGVGVGPDGAVVVGGNFAGTYDFGAGTVGEPGGHVFVLKLEPDGDLAWSVANDGIGDFGSPAIGGVAIDGAGKIHLGGWFTGEIGFGGPLVFTEGQLDAWVATLSPGGAPLSLSAHGSGPNTWQMIIDIATDAAGRTAVAGPFQGTIAFGDEVLAVTPGDTKYDAFTARFDEAGAPIAARGFGAPGEQFGDLIALGADGSSWLAGSFKNSFEIGGETLTVTEADGFLARLCP